MNTYQSALLRIGYMVVLLALLVCPVGAEDVPTDYLLVKLDASVLDTADKVLSVHGFSRWESLRLDGWFRAYAPAERLHRVQESWQDDSRLLAVEQDAKIYAAYTPDDYYWYRQWGPVKINAPLAWGLTTGSPDIVVAVLDSGINMIHPDLAGQLWVNPGEIPDDDLDNDGNGYIDDIHGWRFLYQDQSNDLEDGVGHGTHVAGTIAALGDNQIGIAGMAWSSKLMILKVLDDFANGEYSDVAEGIRYAVDNGAQVINLSLGGYGDLDVLSSAVDYATNHGVLLVAATGNNDPDGTVLYPAAYSPVLAVAASDQADRRASYSNNGLEVDVTAPGSEVFSTCIGGVYCTKSGTSMATPHVSGLAALLWSENISYTVDQITYQITSTAVDIESPGWDTLTGWGRVDAQRAMSLTFHTLYFPTLYGN